MKDQCLNPTYMNKIFISGLLVTFWFDKNIFDLHGTLFFSDFLFIISIDLFWNKSIYPFQWIPCGGPFYLVTSRFFGWHYVACERISTPTEWIHRTSKTDLFWSIYVKYKKVKLSEKNSVRRKMDLSNQKITRRSEIDICSRKYGRRNYLSYL